MQSRIPNVYHNKRLRRSSQDMMLKDVTNTRYLYQRDTNTTNRYKSKLTFGDETSIELVKNRQRKILNDINRLNQEIYAINENIATLKDDELMTLRQDTQLLCNEMMTMHVEIDENETEIQRVEDEIVYMTQCDKMWIENVTLKNKIECQDKFNQLEMNFIERRGVLEQEMNESIESFTPPGSVIESIDGLKTMLETYRVEWGEIQLQNGKKLSEKETETLKPGWQEFQRDKTSKLEALIQSNDTLHSTLDTVTNKRSSLYSEIDELVVEIAQSQKLIASLTQEIATYKETTTALTHKLDSHITPQWLTTAKITEALQEQYHLVCDEINVNQNKLEAAQRRNRTLDSAISKCKTPKTIK
ncbi:hypothetical protein MOUN0_B03642 [Monosporozyma unispora]